MLSQLPDLRRLILIPPLPAADPFKTGVRFHEALRNGASPQIGQKKIVRKLRLLLGICWT